MPIQIAAARLKFSTDGILVVGQPANHKMPSPSFGVDLRAEEDLRAEDLAWLCQEPVIEPGPGLVLPGTFRWIIDAECARELLVVDAHLMPRKYTRWAKRACKVFVFPDRDHHSIDQLMQPIEDDWQAEEFADEFAGALSGRIPAGAYRDVWALSVNGKYLQKQRTLAMALMLACSLRRGRLGVADSTVDKELEAVEGFWTRLVNEAALELWKQRQNIMPRMHMHLLTERSSDESDSDAVDEAVDAVDALQDMVTVDEAVDAVDALQEMVDAITVDEIPERSSDESDSEYMSYEEYLCIYGAVEDERPGQTADVPPVSLSSMAAGAESAGAFQAGKRQRKRIPPPMVPPLRMVPREVKEECAVASDAHNEVKEECENGQEVSRWSRRNAKQVRDNWQEPQGDSPAGNVTDPEVDVRFTISQAEGRHIPRPVDQDGRAPTRKGKGKGNKGKAKNKGKKGKAEDQGKAKNKGKKGRASPTACRNPGCSFLAHSESEPDIAASGFCCRKCEANATQGGPPEHGRKCEQAMDHRPEVPVHRLRREVPQHSRDDTYL